MATRAQILKPPVGSIGLGKYNPTWAFGTADNTLALAALVAIKGNATDTYSQFVTGLGLAGLAFAPMRPRQNHRGSRICRCRPQ